MSMQVVGVDRVIAVDLQRPGNSTEGSFFDVPVENIMTTELGIQYFADKADHFRGKVRSRSAYVAFAVGRSTEVPVFPCMAGSGGGTQPRYCEEGSDFP